MAKRQRNVSVARGAPTHCGGGHNPLYPLLVSFDGRFVMDAGRTRPDARNGVPELSWEAMVFLPRNAPYFWAM